MKYKVCIYIHQFIYSCKIEGTICGLILWAPPIYLCSRHMLSTYQSPDVELNFDITKTDMRKPLKVVSSRKDCVHNK